MVLAGDRIPQIGNLWAVYHLALSRLLVAESLPNDEEARESGKGEIQAGLQPTSNAQLSAYQSSYEGLWQGGNRADQPEGVRLWALSMFKPLQCGPVGSLICE